MIKNYTATNVNDLRSIAADFLESIGSNRIIAFYGSMGAGKTTFIKALCDLLKVTDTVNSPSFAIINEYSVPNNGSIYHFDFYRLKNINEAFDMGCEDYFYSGNYCFVEWPEKVEELMPPNHVRVTIDIVSPQERKITVDQISNSAKI